jgi:hypothetical protein
MLPVTAVESKNLNWSQEQVIDITNSIFSITVEMPYQRLGKQNCTSQTKNKGIYKRLLV